MLTEKMKEMSTEELTALKKEITFYLKERKEGDKEKIAQKKEERADWAKENLSVNDVITFTYKGEVLEGEISKINDKTFTVAFEYEGEDKILPRRYSYFVEIVNEDEEVA